MVIVVLEAIVVYLVAKKISITLARRQVRKYRDYWVTMATERLDEWRLIFGSAPLKNDERYVLGRAEVWHEWANMRLFGVIIPGVIAAVLMISALVCTFTAMPFSKVLWMLHIGGGFLICAVIVETTDRRIQRNE